MTKVILYTSEDGKNQIQLRADEQTVWLTQLEGAERFDATKQNISLHLNNVFEDGGLGATSVVKESLTAQTKLNQMATTGKSSDVQTRTIERCEVSGIAIGKTGSATP